MIITSVENLNNMGLDVTYMTVENLKFLETGFYMIGISKRVGPMTQSVHTTYRIPTNITLHSSYIYCVYIYSLA